MTEGYFVERSLYNELDQNFFEAEERIKVLEREQRSMQKVLDEKVGNIESLTEVRDRL